MVLGNLMHLGAQLGAPVLNNPAVRGVLREEADDVATAFETPEIQGVASSVISAGAPAVGRILASPEGQHATSVGLQALTPALVSYLGTEGGGQVVQAAAQRAISPALVRQVGNQYASGLIRDTLGSFGLGGLMA